MLPLSRLRGLNSPSPPTTLRKTNARVLATGLKSALQTLASGALSDGGENVLAAEVLWTPEEPWEVLSREDVIEDFPELMDL